MKELTNNPAGNFFLLAGPCVIESEEMAMRIAEHIVRITERLRIPYAFKGSYRKANRSRLDSFTGIGDEKALKVLEKVHRTFGIPTVTDIHSAQEADIAAQYVDILQIPAFLCRQTDLLVAAARTGRTINIKKGQFLSPLAMRFAAEKVAETGNPNVMLTERGTTSAIRTSSSTTAASHRCRRSATPSSSMPPTPCNNPTRRAESPEACPASSRP